MKKTTLLLIPFILIFTGCGLLDKEEAATHANVNEVVEEVNGNINKSYEQNINNDEEIISQTATGEELSDVFKSIIDSDILDYKVSPNGNYLVVQTVSEGGVRLIRIFNADGKEEKIYASQDLGNTNPENAAKTIPNLINWSDDSRSLWGSNTLGASIDSFFKIDTVMWHPFIFNVQDFPIQLQEYYLNTNNDKIIYSDYPISFDVDSSNEFKASGIDVHLYILNLMDNQQEEIATSKAKRFEPKWIDNDTVEYNDPENGERIQKKINN